MSDTPKQADTPKQIPGTNLTVDKVKQTVTFALLRQEGQSYPDGAAFMAEISLKKGEKPTVYMGGNEGYGNNYDDYGISKFKKAGVDVDALIKQARAVLNEGGHNQDHDKALEDSIQNSYSKLKSTGQTR